MIREGLPVMWLLVGACLASAELPPRVQGMLGVSPYNEYLACGVPLPPLPEQVAAMPESQLRAAREGMKRVLLRGMARTRDARWRETPENLAAMAAEAEKSGCPAEFADILKTRADGDVSRRVSYVLRRAQEQVQQVYGVDELQMRLMLEFGGIGADGVDALLAVLPIHAVFNMVPAAPPTEQGITADLRCYAQTQLDAAAVLATAVDEATAAAAVRPLAQLLLLHDTTLPTRSLLMQGLVHPREGDMQAAAAALAESGKPLREQRLRLEENGWYGCPLLKAVDALLN